MNDEHEEDTILVHLISTSGSIPVRFVRNEDGSWTNAESFTVESDVILAVEGFPVGRIVLTANPAPPPEILDLYYGRWPEL